MELSYRTWWLLTILFAFNPYSYGQLTRIKGIVKDAQTGEPIAYASVYVKNSSIATYTNDSGAYVIETRQKKSTRSLFRFWATEAKPSLLKEA